jgi:hypothetical protein
MMPFALVRTNTVPTNLNWITAPGIEANLDSRRAGQAHAVRFSVPLTRADVPASTSLVKRVPAKILTGIRAALTARRP